jgi:hypothetical protein
MAELGTPVRLLDTLVPLRLRREAGMAFGDVGSRKMAQEHKDSRSGRLGAALRENLRRRKIQQRGREVAGPEEGDGTSQDAVDEHKGRNDGRQGG